MSLNVARFFFLCSTYAHTHLPVTSCGQCHRGLRRGSTIGRAYSHRTPHRAQLQPRKLVQDENDYASPSRHTLCRLVVCLVRICFLFVDMPQGTYMLFPSARLMHLTSQRGYLKKYACTRNLIIALHWTP